jgi:hypothetical protein
MVLAYKLIDLDYIKESVRLYDAIIDVRVFWPSEFCSCKAIIWIRNERANQYGWGVGITKGYGYHHESTAIHDAFCDMGILFDENERFDLAGTKMREEAIIEIGKAMGYTNTLLVYFNP